MSTACTEQRERLLDAALGQQPPVELLAHLRSCPRCAAALAELRGRSERLNSLLPLVARHAEPSPDFRARVLSAADRRGSKSPLFRRWALAGFAAACVAVAAWLTYAEIDGRREARVVPVERIAHWRAPSDVFLEVAGAQNLRTIPRLGQSIVSVSVTQTTGGLK